MRLAPTLLAATLAAACGESRLPAPPPQADYVTSEVCARCHPGESSAWRGSHHEQAMLPATTESVRGDFGDTVFDDGRIEWRFFRRGEQFVVHTEGPDGGPADFPVRFTFGAVPLQQYLVELPGGRLQALTVAWDTRPAARGGGRWFSLSGDESPPPGDVLHWTGAGLRWNAMCADCHSTAVRSGFDLDTNRYDTTWSDVNVGCEACHGPGSRHLAWAEGPVADDEVSDRGLVVDLRSDGAHWQPDATTGIARRSEPRRDSAELDSCAPCHARRSRLSQGDPGAPFLDRYRPALLEAGLYHADGQVLEEVYVWGSFVQSRMYRAGVSCGDCHEPHSLALHGGADGVCAQCHSPERFADRGHHQHEPGSAGAACVACHMPARTFMRLDARRDHGFRVPRPDLSMRVGTPNACTDCHRERSSDWAASQVAGWPEARRPGTPHFADAFAAARAGTPGAGRALLGVARDRDQAGIVRATALAELRDVTPEERRALVSALRASADPLVRYGVATAAEGLPIAERMTLLEPLLHDSTTLVRAEVGRVLAESLRADASPSGLAALELYRGAQLANADQPGSHVNLGLLNLSLGRLDQAEADYRRALRVGPYFVPAYVNLADLYRATGRDAEGERVLLDALVVAPEVPEGHHALGLLRVRQRRLDAALPSLRRAAETAPGNARFAYVYGVALHSAGRSDEALAVLEAALAIRPHDAELAAAVSAIRREAGTR